jgi:hypothetical protein
VLHCEVSAGEESGKAVCCHQNISDAWRQLFQANVPFVRVTAAINR